MWKWLNPWGEIRRLKRDLADRERQIRNLERTVILSSETYDKIRVSNAELRSTLDLYRRSGM